MITLIFVVLAIAAVICRITLAGLISNVPGLPIATTIICIVLCVVAVAFVIKKLAK